MQGEVDAYQAKVNEAQTYYDSLDAQVKAQLAEEAARAAETNQATNVSTAVEAIQNSQTSQGSTTSGQKENGTSAGNSAEESLLQGLSELVERHTCCRADRERPQTATIDPAGCDDPI